MGSQKNELIRLNYARTIYTYLIKYVGTFITKRHVGKYQILIYTTVLFKCGVICSSDSNYYVFIMGNDSRIMTNIK